MELIPAPLEADELPIGVEAICEHCGQPAEYDSVLCLCINCKIDAAST